MIAILHQMFPPEPHFTRFGTAAGTRERPEQRRPRIIKDI